jgi:hypothetical protein
MPRKIRQLKRDLRRAGAEKVHQKGDHEKWAHPLVRDYYVALSGADGDDARRYQEHQVSELLRWIQRAAEK